MRGTWWLAPALLGLCPVACGSDKPGAPAAGGGFAGTSPTSAHGGGGKGGSAGETSPPSGGAAGDSAEGGAASDLPPIGDIAGAPSGDNGGAPANVPAECDAKATWGSPISLGGINTTDADEHLLTMTHDELSLVFLRAGKLFVADRASAGVDFAPPVELTLPAGYTHQYGLALDPDGLALVIVSTDGKLFADVSRGSRSGTFAAEASTARFELVNDAASFTGSVASPVLSRDGMSFFYVLHMASDAYVYRARGNAVFEDGANLDGSALDTHDGKAKLSLSVSADQRVIFVFDEALGHAAGLWSGSASEAFTQLVHFPGLESVFTNEGCSRLYGTRKVQSSLDVVIETPK